MISRALPNPIRVPHEAQVDRVQRLGPRPLSANSEMRPQPARNLFVRRGVGAFGVGQVAFEQFPFRIWKALVARHCRKATDKSFDYGDPLGLEELRQVIAAYVRTARSVQCQADQVVIVSGSQQALAITSRVLLDPTAACGWRSRATVLHEECFASVVVVSYRSRLTMKASTLERGFEDAPRRGSRWFLLRTNILLVRR